MHIIEVLLGQLPECHVPLSPQLAGNVVTDGLGQNVKTFSPDAIRDSGSVQFPEIYRCLPMVLQPVGGGNDKSVLAIHAVVSDDLSLCTTPNQLTGLVDAHLQQYGSEVVWQLNVAQRMGLDPYVEVMLDDPVREALIDGVVAIEQQHPNVGINLVRIGTAYDHDHLAYSLEQGFQQVVLGV
jgi:hypothetical protein